MYDPGYVKKFWKDVDLGLVKPFDSAKAAY
jgi:hypothetical protein